MSRTVPSAASLLRAASAPAPALAGRSSQLALSASRAQLGSKSTLHTSRPSLVPQTTNTISIDPRIIDGSAGFLPKENVDRLVEWQTGLWERLAAEVRNNPGLREVKQKWDRGRLDMTALLALTAKDPSLTLAFNYASALLNNSYFLESINPSDEQSVSSFAEQNAAALKEKVEAYADGIIGGGWLWLVRTGVNYTDLDILPTFGAGTLLITQRSQIGRDNVPIFGTPSSSSYPSDASPSSSEPLSSADTLADKPPATPTRPPLNQATAAQQMKGRALEQRQLDARSPILPVPLAVLNLHEMAYLGSKYGVWDRRRYAGDWFRSLDWARISVRAKSG